MKLIIINTGICTTTIKGKEYCLLKEVYARIFKLCNNSTQIRVHYLNTTHCSSIGVYIF